MIQIKFTPKEQDELRRQRFRHPHPRVQSKMDVLLFKSYGFAHGKIAQICGIDQNTLRSYLRQYQQGGIERLKQLNFNRPQSQLNAHQKTLEQQFKENPPATISQASEKIFELTGIRRQPTQVTVFLKKIGLKRRKVASVPAKADPSAQQEFKKKVGAKAQSS